MSLLKNASFAVAVTVLALVVGGYVAAHASRSSIERDTRAYIVSHNISGSDLFGPVAPTEITVYSELSSPFVVTVTYVVPVDIHVSYYHTRYLVLPWARYEVSREETHLL